MIKCPYCHREIISRAYELATPDENLNGVKFDSLYCLNNYVWEENVDSPLYRIIAIK